MSPFRISADDRAAPACRPAPLAFPDPTIGQIFKTYRAAHHITQDDLAQKLGIDQTYISMIETGKRSVNDIQTRKNIATTLSLSPQAVGLSPEDFAVKHSEELVELSQPIVRLAVLARNAGHANEAVLELQPLLRRLENQIACDRGNSDLLLASASVKTSLATALGDLLTEDKLYVSIRHLASSWDIVEEIGSGETKSAVLKQYGNELRKYGDYERATEVLEHALALAPDATTRGVAAACLARTHALMGNRIGFDEAITAALRSLDNTVHFTSTYNPISIQEIRLRGLLDLDETDLLSSASLEAIDPDSLPTFSVAPQWWVIRDITMAEVRFAVGDIAGGLTHIRKALDGAEACRLPQQVTRLLQVLNSASGNGADDEIQQRREEAHRVLGRLVR